MTPPDPLTTMDAHRMLDALDAAMALPLPIGVWADGDWRYPAEVRALIHEIRTTWRVSGYSPARDGRWTEDTDVAAGLTVAGLRGALTWLLRAERLSTGSWSSLVRPEPLGRLRQRLAELKADGTFQVMPSWSPPDVPGVLD